MQDRPDVAEVPSMILGVPSLQVKPAGETDDERLTVPA